MRPVTIEELREVLERLGRNKSGGPSQLTAEMLMFASPEAQAAFILPFLNLCIQQKNTPMFTKMFNIWCIEKTQGVGPILHPTNKLDVRPISLFEVSFKLMETVLATRISNAMTPKLHPAQHVFNALRVVDAIVTYTLIMEERKFTSPTTTVLRLMTQFLLGPCTLYTASMVSHLTSSRCS
jgi:hypothetical protein